MGEKEGRGGGFEALSMTCTGKCSHVRDSDEPVQLS
jgi:hypothetical protein